MSDEKQGVEQPKKPSKQDVMAYVNDIVKGPITCEVCGNNKFGFIANPAEEDIGLVARKPGGPLQSVLLCSIECDRCGNVKCFSLQRIMDWMASKT